MEKKLFGTLPTGEEVYIYKLSSKNTEVYIMNRGATIVSLVSHGIDVIGGFDTLEGYINDTGSYQGALIGRVGNRIENGILTIDSEKYTLYQNNGNHSLHGGKDGFDKKIFTVESYDDSAITLSYLSADGEEGYPGNLSVKITYTLIGDALMLNYTAVSDKKTAISLTNHSYFNLDGFKDTIYDHTATIYADRTTAVNEALIPNGERPLVDGTVFDFRSERKIGESILNGFNGYDHNYILSPKAEKDFNGYSLPIVATFKGKKLAMSVYTDRPCAQFYSANFLDGTMLFKGGVPAIRHGAFCFETQTEPNSVNHGIGIYDKGEIYTHNTVYEFEEI